MDLAAYFQRVGYRGRWEPSLALLSALTSLHTQTIPFENLDVLLARPISLEPEALFQNSPQILEVVGEPQRRFGEA